MCFKINFKDKMKNLFRVVLIVGLFLLFITNVIFAQGEPDSNKTKGQKDTTVTKKEDKKILVSIKEEDKLDTTTFKINELKLIGYPYAFYTPETQLAFGLGGMIYFRTALQPAQKPSKITIGGYYTTNNQYLISLKPRIYFPGKSRNYLESDFSYSYDVLKFYGTGNSTPEIDSASYKSSSFGIYIEAQTKGLLINALQFGLIFDYVNVVMEDKMGNPNLYDSTTIGINGGKVGGIGVSWSFDNRDNISFPSSGGLHKVSVLLYGKLLASDYTYNRYRFDLRQYVAPYKDHILAFNLYTDLSTGSPPFYFMPALGGGTRMRGWFEGRFREKNYITWQAEYRKILFWRIGVAAFYAVGDVFKNFSNLKIDELKQSYGLGLRFVFDPKGENKSAC